jgi:glycosyltransferase involved in cell wall biosynthesis
VNPNGTSRSTYRGLSLAVFQLRPLTPPDQVLDGSNAVLVNILRHFAGLGVRATIHHPATVGRTEPFELFPGVDVKPIPPLLTATDSGSLMADPISHAAAIERVRETLGRSDRFYVHGGNLPYFALSDSCPSVHSIHDFCATESVTSVLNFVGDRLVAVSDYIAACLRAALDRVRRIPSGSLHVVRNGFSPADFSPRDPGRLRASLGLPEDSVCLLYPHRPIADKGIMAALRVLHVLKSLLRDDVYRRVRLLVPAWEAPRFGAEAPIAPPLPPEVVAYATDLGVADRLHVHRWIPVADMPRYYSMGAATLCVGRYPEAFGNVHVESMMSGTPAVIARAGAHRTSVSENLVRKVDPGQDDDAAHHLAEIIDRAERVGPAVGRLLADQYSLTGMLQGYEQAILECEPQAPVTFSARMPYGADPVLRVPPWAASLRSGFYHDFTGYCENETFLRCLPDIESGCRAGILAQRYGVQWDEIERWLDAGLVMADQVQS